MKYIIILLNIMFSTVFAASCSLSIPQANLGTYNQTSGNSILETINVTCLYINSLGTRATTFTLSNGTSNIVGSLTYDSYFSPYYEFSALQNSNTSNTVNGNGTFGTTLSVPSGIALTQGIYSGYISIYTQNSNDSTPYLNSIKTTLVVGSSCQISNSSMAFGSINGGSAKALSSIIYSVCTNGTVYSLSSDGGNSNNIAARIMKNGSDILNYQLYTDSGFTTVWGNGTTGSIISLIGTGSPQSNTIYGAIPSGQRPTPGTYTDTVNITMTY